MLSGHQTPRKVATNDNGRSYVEHALLTTNYHIYIRMPVNSHAQRAHAAFPRHTIEMIQKVCIKPEALKNCIVDYMYSSYIFMLTRLKTR